jgi:hypothetical protein
MLGAMISEAAGLQPFGSSGTFWTTILPSSLHHLDNLKVATAIRSNPGARLVVSQKGTAVVLEEVPEE